MDRQPDQQIIGQVSLKERFPLCDIRVQLRDSGDVFLEQSFQIGRIEILYVKMVSLRPRQSVSYASRDKKLVLALGNKGSSNTFYSFILGIERPKFRY